jgi:hypothetical protein
VFSDRPQITITGDTDEVTMTQPAAYARYNQRVWTNANLDKDFLKVKTYYVLIVLK